MKRKITGSQFAIGDMTTGDNYTYLKRDVLTPKQKKVVSKISAQLNKTHRGAIQCDSTRFKGNTLGDNVSRVAEFLAVGGGETMSPEEIVELIEDLTYSRETDFFSQGSVEMAINKAVKVPLTPEEMKQTREKTLEDCIKPHLQKDEEDLKLKRWKDAHPGQEVTEQVKNEAKEIKISENDKLTVRNKLLARIKKTDELAEKRFLSAYMKFANIAYASLKMTLYGFGFCGRRIGRSPGQHNLRHGKVCREASGIQKAYGKGKEDLVKGYQRN